MERSQRCRYIWYRARFKSPRLRALAQFEKNNFAMRGRLSILRDAKETNGRSGRCESECGAYSRPLYRATNTTTLAFRGEANAQRGCGNFGANGRKQRRKGTGSYTHGRTPVRDRTPRRARQVEEEIAVTTIVSLAARDFIAVGCDSLATTSADLVYPSEITSVYFDASGKLKLDALGKPLLQHSSQIWEKAKSKPIDQLPNVTKLYDLHPFRACVLFAGTSRIGNTTISHIVDTFLAQGELRNRKSTYTIGWLAQKFTDHVMKIYDKEIPSKWARPMAEVILSGYSATHRLPELWRITFSYNRAKADFVGTPYEAIPRGEFNVIFGGQYDVIQRVVNGIDWESIALSKSGRRTF